MNTFRVAVLACFFFFSGVPAAMAASAPLEVSDTDPLAWRSLEPGLEIVRTRVLAAPPTDGGADAVTEGRAAALPGVSPEATMLILRIDPARFEFSLHMASESGVRSLASIGASEKLVAAVNAGMYLPDHSTNTGYLRSRTHTNNSRLASGYGAFFVAGPKDAALPPALLLDRNKDDWQTAIRNYDLVMQNYRMTAADGRIVWKQPDRAYSIAALSQDEDGRVLFLLCATPVPALDFITTVLALPLGAKSIMYLEGGSEAALLIRAGGINVVEAGRHPSGFWGGSANLLLPNVLGVKRR